ncbi:hypothetical protein QJS04_geneDACA003744 [Acorus gramineus]|uniref:Protein OS9-like domain-containing protein n=1 Tax=Acorus gramineus TaxID=55184 RepID=A0AAV9BKY2_ACOGR|nr:hypothetical protein QJS04_geneDACA003744 [Acorus gramineus]
MNNLCFWISVLSLLRLLVAASADQIFPAHSGIKFGRSFREPKYVIEFHSMDSPFHPDNDQEAVVMANNKGQNFLCFLPVVEETKTVEPTDQQNTSNVIVESTKRTKLKSPDELMEVLKDRCFYRQEGWWSYEFCYQDKLRQFHLDEDNKAVQEFLLGIYDPEATDSFNQNHSIVSTLKDPRSKDASQRYHAHQFTNGTICDLTNQPRETESTCVFRKGSGVNMDDIKTKTATIDCHHRSPLPFLKPLLSPVSVHCGNGDKSERETSDRSASETFDGDCGDFGEREWGSLVATRWRRREG